MAKQIRRSSGNVFLDLGFDTEEAENLRVRSELMMESREACEKTPPDSGKGGETAQCDATASE